MNLNQIDFGAAEARQVEMRREVEKQRLVQLARQAVKANNKPTEPSPKVQTKPQTAILRPRAT